MGEVVVTAIQNRSKQTFQLQRGEGGFLEIQPNETISGPFTIRYDEDQHGVIPSPNKLWIIDGPDPLKWATVVGWVSPA